MGKGKNVRKFRDFDENGRFDRKRSEDARYESRIKRDNKNAKRFVRETAGA